MLDFIFCILLFWTILLVQQCCMITILFQYCSGNNPETTCEIFSCIPLYTKYIKAWIKRGWESMRVGRREFAWVFPQLPLLGQTSSESCMRVDEFFKFSRFCLLLPCFFFFVFWCLSNCWQTFLLLLLWVMTWISLASGLSWVSENRSETSAILLNLELQSGNR